MIAHVILFRPKPEMSPDERQTVLDGLASAAVDIPSVRSLRVGRRVRHGRQGYEQMMQQDFDYAVIVEFDDVAGLSAYLAHPTHNAIAEHFAKSSAAALAYDYEMIELKTEARKFGSSDARPSTGSGPS
jgi:hypothetical protein